MAQRTPPTTDDTPQPNQRWTPALALATGLFLGYFPVAPGTLGTLWGFPLIWALQQLPNWWWHGAAIVGLAAVGIPLCTRAARQLGRKDPGAVVWDEFTTLPITFFAIPPEFVWKWPVPLVGFLLHRMFDISKLPPARQLETLPAGVGIMADDWSAGVYSCISLQLLLYLGWIPGVGA